MTETMSQCAGWVIGGDDPTRECHDYGYRWVEVADLGEDDDPEGS